MFLKDRLKDTYQKASYDRNHLMVENIINIWAHRFGIESLNELTVKNQDQIKLKEDDQKEEYQNQINLELVENCQYEEKIEFQTKDIKKFDNAEIIDKDNHGSYTNKSEYNKTEKLPLPKINNLRKWINKEKKAG